MAWTPDATGNAQRERLRGLLAQLEAAPVGGRRDAVRQQVQTVIADIRRTGATLDAARRYLTADGAQDRASSRR